MRRLFLLCALVAMCIAAVPALASVAFNDFNENHGYNEQNGGTVGGPDSGFWSVLADQFISSVTGEVSEIDLALTWSLSTNAGTVSLWTDNSGIPGTQLGSWDIFNLPQYGRCCDYDAITGIHGISLEAGKTYFVVSSAPGDTLDVWNYNTVNYNGLVDQSLDGGKTWLQESDYVPGAFEIFATPEPSTLMMLGSGLLAAAAGAFRRTLT